MCSVYVRDNRPYFLPTSKAPVLLLIGYLFVLLSIFDIFLSTAEVDSLSVQLFVEEEEGGMGGSARGWVG